MAARKSRFHLIRSKNKRIDVETEHSRHTGVAGVYETFLRRFKVLAQVFTVAPLYVLGSLCIGTALSPALYFYKYLNALTVDSPAYLQILTQGFSIGFGYFLYGFALILIIPTLNAILRTYPKPHRGPYMSVEFLTWYIHNGMTYLVRYTFLEFITPTPFNLWFFRSMGMKIGRNCQINSANISDPALIELGDRVTVGGSATVTAHYGQGGFLVLAPTKIGNNVTLGMKCTIMGGVTIGDDVKVLPNSVVLPKTVIPSGEIWGGVPAIKIH